MSPLFLEGQKVTKKRTDSKQIRLGDVVEIPLATGFAYVQFVFEDKGTMGMGELVRVFPERREQPATSLAELTLNNESYYVFCPIRTAAKKGWIKILGNAPVPEKYRIRPAFKINYAFDRRDKSKLVWFIIEPGTGTSRKVGSQLSPEDRTLPMHVIWGLDLLKERIEKGWTPEDEA
jgi:hypothetical protein